jgi:isoleucyl-tRNA synthetase
VPGWDCHGLPIEVKALEKHRLENEGKETVLSAVAIRAAARALATRTVEDQKKGFREWAIMADWDNAWRTLDRNFEMKQMEVFQEMVKKGLIFRRNKPVYWSPSSKTALAEAELEYKEDHQSTAAYIKFPITQVSPDLQAKGLDFKRLSAVIWTTTPWTLPANRAIAIHRDLEYTVVKHGEDQFLLAKSRFEHVMKLCFPDETPEILVETVTGAELEGCTYVNSLRGKSAPPQPVIHADFVSAESGSGLVHLAPGHGHDDYEVCLKLGIRAFAPIDDAGCFTDEAFPDEPRRLTGQSVLKGASKEVLKILDSSVLNVHKYKHKYPYDWRTKLPVVVRATEQWFADVGHIKDAAMKSLDDVKFVPESGRARLESFVKGRSEWCISRQRAWGVPIPALYDESGKAVLTDSSVAHIIFVINERGTDSWWTDAEDEVAWIPAELRGASYRRGRDTMDVWFDSGSSWTQTPERADVYLEGSDQHRGWFQSSLLTHQSASGRDTAPFKTLITHGFTLDHKGRKMSKSIGNTISPGQIMDGSLLPASKKGKSKNSDALGADALRLWAASSDYTKDIAIGQPVLKLIRTSLLKYRSTIKMLLGSMHEDAGKTITKMDMIALLQLEDVMSTVFEAYKNHEFHKGINALNKWINTDLSAFYMDAIKDRLYCGDGGGVLHEIHDGLLSMLAPITPILVEESWEHTPEWVKKQSEHPLRRTVNTTITAHLDQSLLSEIRADLPWLMKANDAIKTAQEEARLQKLIGSSLQSTVVLALPAEAKHLFQRYQSELQNMFVVSTVDLDAAVEGEWKFFATFDAPGGKGTAWVLPPRDAKCPRCWRYVAPVEDELCGRCEDVVQ